MLPYLSSLYKDHLRPKESQDNFPAKQLFVLGTVTICSRHTVFNTDSLRSQHYAAYANRLPLCPSSLMPIA